MTSARYKPQATTNPPKTYHFEWGDVGFRALEPDAPFGFAESPSEVLPFIVEDFTAGFRAFKGIADWATQDRNAYYLNTGVYGLWLPESIGVKAYAITTQTSVVSADFSTFNSTNKRIHSVMWPTSTGLRQIFGIGSRIFKDTSVSDPSITVPSTADNVTDDITAMWIGPTPAGALALWIGTNNTTDDVKYTTDPTANSITWTSGVTFPSSGDTCYWGAHLPHLGNGWHVACMKLSGGTPKLYAWKQTEASPLTTTTMEPVVYADTAAHSNSDNPIQSTGAVLAYDAITGILGEYSGSGWSSIDNITTDNGTYATSSTTNQLSQVIVGLFNMNSYLPSTDVDIAGVEFSYQRLESDANADTETALLLLGHYGIEFDPDLLLAVSPAGFNAKDSAEWGTSVEEIVTGGPTDLLGTFLSPAEWRQSNLGVALAHGTGVIGYTVSVEAFKLNLHYRRTGYQVTSTEGSWSMGPHPSNPSLIGEIGPVGNDATGVVLQREFRVYDLAYNPASDRLVGVLHKPQTGLTYVKDGCHFLGGWALAGGPKSDGQIQIMFTRNEGGSWVTDPLNFPGSHGDTQQDVYFMVAQDNDLIVGVCDSDGSDRQLWKFNVETGWHALGAQQSISGTTIASKPLLSAERTLNLQQSQSYCFYPNSTTSLHVAREFVPPDLSVDPRVRHTSQAKIPAAVRVTGLRLNFDSPNTPPPHFNTLLSAEVRNTEVDDGTTYETLRVLFDKDGDHTFADLDFDHTFDAAGEVFTPYFVRSGGLAFTTGIVALEAGAGTGTKTPNILPVVLKFASQTESDRVFQLRLDPNQDMQDIIRRLETAKRSKSVRPLIFPSGFPFMDQDANRNVPTMFSYEQGRLVFREVPGSAT